MTAVHEIAAWLLLLKRIEQERDRQTSAADAAKALNDPDSAERERTHRFTAGVLDSLLWE